MKPRLREILATSTFLVLAATATVADAAIPNPTANQTAEIPSVCAAQPTGAACENRWISNLDRARAAMGFGPYMLPRDFTSLVPDRQVLILANLDRIAYGVPAIVGIDPSLTASLNQAVSADADPLPPSGYPTTGVYGSTWGAGFSNIVHGYWAWFYDDGYGSANLDCSSPTAPGCWIHRQALAVSEGAAETNVMEAAAGTDSAGRASYAVLVAGRNATAPAPAYSYTWAQAVADGAGTYAYDPGAATNPRLTIKITGRGTVAGSVSCRSECRTSRSPGTRMSLRAKPKRHARFLGWGGACHGKGACRLTLKSDTRVTARFGR